MGDIAPVRVANSIVPSHLYMKLRVANSPLLALDLSSFSIRKREAGKRKAPVWHGFTKA